MDPAIEVEGLKGDIINELKDVGVCDLCTLRYLGVKDPFIYRDKDAVRKMLTIKKDTSEGENKIPSETPVDTKDEEDGPRKAKLLKLSPCVACLGLLQECIEEPCLNQIVSDIKKADVEACSYGPMLTLPVAIQIRAYALWFHLIDKFPQVYNSLGYLKPEGIGMKAVWKYVCGNVLNQKVDPAAQWITNGSLVLNMFLTYPDEAMECMPLYSLLKRGKKNAEVTRGSAENTFSCIEPEDFRKRFTSPPTIPKNGLVFDKIVCNHSAIFLAGRYCKYSRDVSQSPWMDADGKRVRGQGSVQEFISAEVLPLFKSEQLKFSASGREDSDVRMLGTGRPFVVEILNPRKTVFTEERLLQLAKKINESTSLISVRDLKIIEKKHLGTLKDGEETKTKRYTALCRTVGKKVTPEMLQILNETETPLALHQKTPVRVLHRRSLATRTRKILEMSAEFAKKSPEMFILHVKTEAGTYVKEFVHGDFERTQPSVSTLLSCDTEILSLDVEGVDLEWPPTF